MIIKKQFTYLSALILPILEEIVDENVVMLVDVTTKSMRQGKQQKLALLEAEQRKSPHFLIVIQDLVVVNWDAFSS